jgi:hypothetical protein
MGILLEKIAMNGHRLRLPDATIVGDIRHSSNFRQVAPTLTDAYAES